MDYLGRPVFEFPLNWRQQPVKSFSYDLRELRLGFGKPKGVALQKFVVEGFEFSLELRTSADVVAFNEFFSALKGRLRGFWLPSPLRAFRVTSGVSGTQFDIEAQDLADNIDKHPDQFLYFSKEGQPAQAAKIVAVENNSETERVTLDTILPLAIDETWSAVRLHYVRLAADEETGEFIAESLQHRTLRVVELPTEYTAFETGAEPVYLYHFWIDTTPPMHWRFTSFDQDISSNGQNFIASAINHSSLRDSARGDREEVTIEACYEAGHPLSLFSPFPLAKTMNVEILETTFPNPNATTVIFTGQVLEVPMEGHKMTAKCGSFIDVLGQKMLSMFLQNRCNYAVFEPNTCKLSKAAFGAAVTITRIAGNAIEVTGAGLANKPENYFALGWIETGTQGSFEIASILQSTASAGNSVSFVMDRLLVFAVTGQAANIFPGCDGLSQTCKTKFNNFSNWGGHRIPQRNPTIKGIEVQSDSPNKK